MSGVTVTIDTREHRLIELLGVYTIQHEVSAMDLADIDIRGPNGQRFLIERKTVSDLASSLRDGRFKSQKDRLVGVLQREPSTAVAYVFEGVISDNDTHKVNGRVTTGAIRSLLNTLQFRYRIPVIHVRSVKDTVLLIRSIVSQLHRHPDFSPIGSGENSGCAGHADILPQIKRNHRTDPASIWITMLTAVRGISTKVSTAIYKHFENTAEGSLIEYVKEHTRDEFVLQLKEIRQQGRRISSTVCNSVSCIFYSD